MTRTPLHIRSRISGASTSISHRTYSATSASAPAITRAVSRTAITEARNRLADRGIDVVTREGTDADQVSGGFTFRDPAGLQFDLYEEMQQLGSPPTDPDVGFTCNLHGSKFDQEGHVTNGPAARSLKKYPTEIVSNQIIIHLA